MTFYAPCHDKLKIILMFIELSRHLLLNVKLRNKLLFISLSRHLNRIVDRGENFFRKFHMLLLVCKDKSYVKAISIVSLF